MLNPKNHNNWIAGLQPIILDPIIKFFLPGYNVRKEDTMPVLTITQN